MPVSSVGIPDAAGIGLRTPHIVSFACEEPDESLAAPWLEIHSENFLCDGGPRLAMLDAVAARYPISCHGVGLSLGSAEGLNRVHMERLKHLFARVSPGIVSEHLSWSVTGGVYLNDLLPLPYSEAALTVVCKNVDMAQQTFGRRILLENPSGYLRFSDSTMSEPEFLSRLVERTGCGLLLDVNNVYVSAANNNFDPNEYLRAIPAAAVGEIHLAGHTEIGADAKRVLVDTHGARIANPVWDLYAGVIQRIGPRPTLIEWDQAIPGISTLVREALAAQAILDSAMRNVAHVG